MTEQDARDLDLVLGWFRSELPEVSRAIAGLPDLTLEQRRVKLRAARTLWQPGPVPSDVMAAHDRLLTAERETAGVVEGAALPTLALDERLVLWRGDITRLRVGAIVNAANSALLGCFIPLHRCIDNAIHSAAGLGLRAECARIMAARGRPEPAGTATLTGGYCLPAAHVIHTVGPTVCGELTAQHEVLLASGYRSSLHVADAAGLSSIAVCCISTGEFGYPKEAAARTAVATVRDYLAGATGIEKVIFNVFAEPDLAIYRDLLGPDA